MSGRLSLVDIVSNYLSSSTEGLTRAIATTDLPDWGEAAQLAFQTIFPQLLLCYFLLHLQRMRPLALSYGIDIQLSRC